MENKTGFEDYRSRRDLIQEEIRDIYHKIATMELDRSNQSVEVVDSTLQSHMSRIVELEEELAVL